MASQQVCAKVVSQSHKMGRRDVAAHPWEPETLADYEDLGVHPISEVGVGISVPFVPFLIRSHDVAEEDVPPWGKVKLTGSGLANLKLFNLSDELGAVHTLLGQEAGLFMVVVRNLQQLGNRPIRPEKHYLVRVIRPAIGRRDFLDAGLKDGWGYRQAPLAHGYCNLSLLRLFHSHCRSLARPVPAVVLSLKVLVAGPAGHSRQD